MLLFATFHTALAIGSGGSAIAPPAALTTKYHLGATTQQTLDLSAVGGPAQITNLTLDAWIVMTLTDSAGGRVVHVVVDSARSTSDNPMAPAGDPATAKGAMIHGFQDPAGRVKNLTSSVTGNPLVAAVQGAVNGLFPRIKAGAKSGDSWVDTTDVTNPGEGNNTTAKVITTYNAGMAESIGGNAGVHIDAKSTSVIGGSLTNPQAGQIEVEGAGGGSGSFVIGGDGRFLGGRVTSTQDLMLKVAMAPAPLPLKIVQSLAVTVIK